MPQVVYEPGSNSGGPLTQSTQFDYPNNNGWYNGSSGLALCKFTLTDIAQITISVLYEVADPNGGPHIEYTYSQKTYSASSINFPPNNNYNEPTINIEVPESGAYKLKFEMDLSCSWCCGVDGRGYYGWTDGCNPPVPAADKKGRPRITLVSLYQDWGTNPIDLYLNFWDEADFKCICNC